MTRSERHVMFLGGYLGVGLVVVAQSAEGDPSQIPLLMAFFLITGLRLAFDIPATAIRQLGVSFLCERHRTQSQLGVPALDDDARLAVAVSAGWFTLLAIPLNLAFSILGIDLGASHF